MQGNVPSAAFLVTGSLEFETAVGQHWCRGPSCLAVLCFPSSPPFLSFPMPLCWGTQTLSHPHFTFQPCCKPSGSPSSDLPSCKPGMNSFPSCPRWIQAFRKTSKWNTAPGSPICNLLLSQPATPCPCGPALCPDLAGLLQQGTNLRNVAQGDTDADSCLGAGRDTQNIPALLTGPH